MTGRLVAARASLAALAILALAATPALARPFPASIALLDGWAPEGITDGPGTTAFVGSLTAAGIARVNVRTGAVHPLEASAGAVTVTAPSETKSVGSAPPAGDRTERRWPVSGR